MAASSKKKLKAQPKDMVFALDIGTRKVIGMVGRVEGDKLRVIAIEKEEHTKRSMIDGQIEDIEQVAKVARSVKARLEDRLSVSLKRVCIAAAGRALKTQGASFEMQFPQPQLIDKETISRLEAGAISQAETAFSDTLDIGGRRFYLVGHTIVQYYMDNYPISSLLEHKARHIRADVIATFLPSEVVDSLYAVMHKIKLEVASLTLEPIAAINAAIPENLRFLNLALVDIGAGTSDIAVTRDGGIVGYTMATVAGDEITETLMKKFLLDFATAETVKTALLNQDSIQFTDVLGNERTVTKADVMGCIQPSAEILSREIAEHICQVNGGPPSAVFLAGGGSKLEGLRESVSRHLNLEPHQVAIAGRNFQTYAFSDGYDLNAPEYATPLGIAISTGLGLINESFQITLNGSRAKFFRSNTLTVRDILFMNGYTYQDLLPRAGRRLVLEVGGKQTVFYGTPGEPAVLRLNGRDAGISDLVRSGDEIEFTPAVHGKDARRCLKDILAAYPGYRGSVRGKTVSPTAPLSNGDIIDLEPDWPESVPEHTPQPPVTETDGAASPAPAVEAAPAGSSGQAPEPDAYEVPQPPQADAPAPEKETAPEEETAPGKEDAPASEGSAAVPDSLEIYLNDRRMVLSKKADGTPYYLLDIIALSGIDYKNPTGPFVSRVNGSDSSFLAEIQPGDRVEITFKNT